MSLQPALAAQGRDSASLNLSLAVHAGGVGRRKGGDTGCAHIGGHSCGHSHMAAAPVVPTWGAFVTCSGEPCGVSQLALHVVEKERLSPWQIEP